jgi:hypothetical protein
MAQRSLLEMSVPCALRRVIEAIDQHPFCKRGPEKLRAVRKLSGSAAKPLPCRPSCLAGRFRLSASVRSTPGATNEQNTHPLALSRSLAQAPSRPCAASPGWFASAQPSSSVCCRPWRYGTTPSFVEEAPQTLAQISSARMRVVSLGED